jgi:hypothetical protein
MKKTLKSGDILCCKGHSILSKLIMRFTKSNFSHVALVLEIWGELCIVDAQRDGTNLRLFSEWEEKFKYKFVAFRPKEFTNEMKNKAVKKMGFTPYDFISLFVYQPLYIITKKWLGKRGEEATKRMYCSEYAGYVFNLPNWWRKNPQNVYEYCLVSKNFNKI